MTMTGRRAAPAVRYHTGDHKPMPQFDYTDQHAYADEMAHLELEFKDDSDEAASIRTADEKIASSGAYLDAALYLQMATDTHRDSVARSEKYDVGEAKTERRRLARDQRHD